MISRLKLRKKFVLSPTFLGDRKDWNKRRLCLRWAFPPSRYIAFYEDWKQESSPRKPNANEPSDSPRKETIPGQSQIHFETANTKNKKGHLTVLRIVNGRSNIALQQCKKLCPCCNAVRCSVTNARDIWNCCYFAIFCRVFSFICSFNCQLKL